MVSVDRLKPTVSDHNRSILHNTVKIRRPVFPHRLSSDHIINFLAEDTHPFFEEGFSDMERGPTVFDSMFHPDLFSSMYDGIRPGRHHRYKFSHPFHVGRYSKLEDFDDFDAPSSSSKVRVIPIKVEHQPSKSGGKQSERLSLKETHSAHADCPIVLDDSEETEKRNHRQLNIHASPDCKTSKQRDPTVYSARDTDSPIIIDDVSDMPGHIPSPLSSKSPSRNKPGPKLPTGIHHIEGGKSNALKSIPIPVQHLEAAVSLPNKESMILDSKRQSSLSPSQKTRPEVGRADICVEEIDVDLTNPRYGSRPEPTQNKTAFEDNEFFDTEQEINAAPSYPIYDELKVKLDADNRKIDYIRGDGNCFFRALSKQLYGSERYHKAVRSLIVDIIITNKTKFAQFVDGDVQAHVEKMSEDHCWATTCEIYAAATLLQRDIYMLTPDHLNQHYSWLLFKPVFKSKAEHNGVSSHPCYITLCNTNGNHYDRVVPDHGGCNCFAPQPELDGISDSVDLTSQL